jgi:hypothetical protein
MATPLGTLPPGDVGYYIVDWTAELGAVAGDALSGNLTVESASPDLSISNLNLSGSSLAFNASAEVAATYLLTARAGFEPSGRRASKQLELVVGVPPAVEPISLDEGRRHLRLDTAGNPPTHPDDDLVLGWITAAREYVEQETGLSLVTASKTDYRDSWQGSSSRHRTSLETGFHPMGSPLWWGLSSGRLSFVLVHAPVISVEEIRYLDADGEEQVLPPDQYRLTPDGVLMRVEQAVGVAWPATYFGAHGVVQIDYTAGFSGPIPEALRTAIKLMLGVYYENRGVLDRAQGVPQGVDALIDKYRIM